MQESPEEEEQSTSLFSKALKRLKVDFKNCQFVDKPVISTPGSKSSRKKVKSPRKAYEMMQLSPSLFSKASKRLNIDFNNMDDFEPVFTSTCNPGDFGGEAAEAVEKPVTSKPGSKLSRKKVKSAKNAYGMAVEKVTASQAQRAFNMKQGKIDALLTKKGSSSTPKPEQGSGRKVRKLIKIHDVEVDDLKLGMTRSLETCKNETAKKHNLEVADGGQYGDSFDSYTPPKVGDSPSYKYVNATVRSKEGRKKLKGFTCKNCEAFYAGDNLSNSQREALIDKCSKHRAKFAPPRSPQNIWKIDMLPDRSQDRTQHGPSHRELLRLEREREKMKKQAIQQLAKITEI